MTGFESEDKNGNERKTDRREKPLLIGWLRKMQLVNLVSGNRDWALQIGTYEYPRSECAVCRTE